MTTRPNARKAPAKKAAPRKSTGSAPALNLSSLSVSEAPSMPTGGKAGGVNLDDTPFPAALTASWENATERKGRKYGAAKSVTVPEGNVKQIERILRACANRMDGVGVRIAAGKPDAQGNVVVAFRAQTGRAAKSGKGK